MRIGVSYWGFAEELDKCSGVDTPDGGRYTRPLLFKELSDRGHDIICLQEKREENPLDFLKYPNELPDNLDAVFLEWRWPTYKNDWRDSDFLTREREPDLLRQNEIMHKYSGRIPIILFDTDLKFEPPNNESKSELKKKGIKVLEPAVSHSSYAETMLYWSDFDFVFEPREHNDYVTYVGSNYERYWAVNKYYYEMAQKYINKFGESIDIEFTGNWLDFSPERPFQKQKVNQYKDLINFNERNTMYEGFQQINKAISTIHIGKKKYMERGVITPRYLESLVCGIPALTPEEFKPKAPYGEQYEVNSARDAAEKIQQLSKLDKTDRQIVVRNQMRTIQTRYGVHVRDAANKIQSSIRELK